jgi:hypothetical protein
VLRRVPVLRVPVERARVPVERVLVERRRVPPVERAREVVLRERDVEARRVPVERDRLVVVRPRPRLDVARAREISGSGCSSDCCCETTGLSSGTISGGVMPPNV